MLNDDKKVKKYPEFFRKEAIRLADQPGRTATDVAKELVIHVGQIYNWRAQYSKLSKKQFKIVDGVNYSKMRARKFASSGRKWRNSKKSVIS